MKWKRLQQSVAYQGFFELLSIDLQHDLYAGGESPVLHREFMRRGDVAAVLPYDPVRDELVLIEQFRIGAQGRADGPWIIEVIAGYQEPSETLTQVAIRESREEAGCHISKLHPMLQYYSSPGGSTERIHVYMGLTNTEHVGGVHGLATEGEDIRVHVVSPQTAYAWLDNGRIDSAMPLVAIQWFRQNHDKVRQLWLD